MNDRFLQYRLDRRKQDHLYRTLAPSLDSSFVDFSSNDYLGLSTQPNSFINTSEHTFVNAIGSTGSRLISGNHKCFHDLENEISIYHCAEDCLMFNSGYSANIGLLSSVVHRHDTVIYDEYIHASLRDGITLSRARHFSFQHNSVADLEHRCSHASGRIFIVTESIFSMDGDEAPLRDIVAICKTYNAFLICDEAHSIGWQGNDGKGLVCAYGLEKDCFARVVTFGKALGFHGAAVLCSHVLKNYLVNFSRPFIYTTALPPNDILRIQYHYKILPKLDKARQKLNELIDYFKQQDFGLELMKSHSPIQGIFIRDNTKAKQLGNYLLENKHYCIPILSPTVPKHSERIRIIIHAFNTKENIKQLAKLCREWKS